MKYLSVAVILTGVLLILSAAALYLKTDREDITASEASARVVEQLQKAVSGEQSESSTDGGETPDGAGEKTGRAGTNGSPAAPDAREAIVTVEEIPYLGTLRFVGYDKTLPVAAEWYFDALQYTPARYSGSVAGNDLVIGAHNYFSQPCEESGMVAADGAGSADRRRIRPHAVHLHTDRPRQSNGALQQDLAAVTIATHNKKPTLKKALSHSKSRWWGAFQYFLQGIHPKIHCVNKASSLFTPIPVAKVI